MNRALDFVADRFVAMDTSPAFGTIALVWCNALSVGPTTVADGQAACVALPTLVARTHVGLCAGAMHAL